MPAPRPAAAVAVAAALIVLPACGGGDSNDRQDARSSARNAPGATQVPAPGAQRDDRTQTRAAACKQLDALQRVRQRELSSLTASSVEKARKGYADLAAEAGTLTKVAPAPIQDPARRAAVAARALTKAVQSLKPGQTLDAVQARASGPANALQKAGIELMRWRKQHC